jgi:hypothetical protein
MRWTGHVACMEKLGNLNKIVLEILKGLENLEDIGG